MRTADTQARMEEMVGSLKAAGHRMTPQRLAILRVLAEDGGHPSVESIYEKLRGDYPSMSLATVYKTIVLLKQLEQLQEVRTDKLGVRYDGQNPDPHIHVVCRNCNHVIDIPPAGLESLMENVGRQAGCRITGHSVVFYGICDACEVGKA